MMHPTDLQSAIYSSLWILLLWAQERKEFKVQINGWSFWGHVKRHEGYIHDETADLFQCPTLLTHKTMSSLWPALSHKRGPHKGIRSSCLLHCDPEAPLQHKMHFCSSLLVTRTIS